MKLFCKYMLPAIFLMFTRPTFSQTVNPGNITKGLTEYKEFSSVDHTTGIMNYNIPLLSVDQDGYNIPISLNYTGKGIKVKAQKGELAGLGWTLGYGGGLIIRTIRGGFADENRTLGILFNPIPQDAPSLLTHAKKITEGKIDGESDIFTVNIKGGTINFMLRLESGILVAHALEKTDVKIECIYENFSSAIKGFKITDSQGYIYTFKASSYSSSFNLSAAAGGSRLINIVTSWYLSTITVPNNGDIVFEYNGDYLESNMDFGDSYIQYGKALVLPKLDSDPNLNSLLRSYGYGNAIISSVQQHIQATKEGLNSLPVRYKDIPDENTGFTTPVDVNEHKRQLYRQKIEGLEKDLSSLRAENSSLSSEIHNILSTMYNTDIQIQNDVVTTGQSNLYPNKLINRIRTRTGIFEFNYAQTPNSDGDLYYISNIKYKTITGDLIKTLVFDVNSKGYLKAVQTIAANEKVEQQYDFEYYNEDSVLDINSQDYWGYYNGKNNSTLFPNDPFYTFLTSGGSPASIFSSEANTLNAEYFNQLQNRYGSSGADRKPVGEVAMARSLKKVSNLIGGSTTFIYEGNEIYSSSNNDNIPIGGIRIKRIITNDGTNDQVVDYKYKFPLPGNPAILKSTGRLVEWKNKYFAFPYNFRDASTNQYTDVHVYHDFIDMSTAPQDNSNNGVLYHYVEEVRADNSITGYKYPAINASENIGVNQPLLDRLLLAKIEYNAAGKILSVQRNTYITNLHNPGTRTEEYNALKNTKDYLIAGTFNPTASILQIKNGPITYNDENLLIAYPDSATAKMFFSSIQYSINPYRRIYLPNYSIRKNITPPRNFFLITDHIILPKTEETNLFPSDYDTAIGYASSNAPALPDERAYLYERLLNAPSIKPVQTITEYIYNGIGHLNPTQIKTTRSNGYISIKKIKYAPDYQTNPGDPIALINSEGRKSSIIEEQLWQSKDNGTTFKFLGGKINEYTKRVANGKNYLFVENEYASNLAAPVSPSSLGYSETISSTAPFNNLFWENKAIYGSPVNVNILDINPTFSRTSAIKDRTGNVIGTKKYDPFNADLLLETKNIEPKNILAFDFGPYQRHPYYSDRFKLFSQKWLNLYNSGFKFSDNPITGSKVPTIANLDNVRYTMELDSILEKFEANGPSAVLDALDTVPTYKAIRELTYNIAHSAEYNEFILSFVKFRNAFEAMTTAHEHTLYSLVNYGINFPEIRAYYLRLREYFYLAQSFDQYNNVMRATPLNVLPISKQAFGLSVQSSVDVDNLISKGIDLDIYQVNANPSTSPEQTYFTYKIKYKDNTSSAANTGQLPVFNNKLWKGQLMLSTLPNAANIQSIEFFFESNSFNRMGTFIAIPKNIPFKAYSYLPNHSPYISFDQTGRYSEFFYDGKLNKHYIKDFKDNIIQTDSVAIGRQEVNKRKPVQVVVSNLHPVNYSNDEVNIIKVKFFDNVKHTSIIKSERIIPGYSTKFEIPEGDYTIYLDADKPIRKVRFGNQEITTSSTNSFVGQVISSGSVYQITITN